MFISQSIANKVFDTSVSLGTKVANRFLQKAINILNYDRKQLIEDGIIDKNTIDRLDLVEQEEAILKIYSLLQKEFYSNVVSNRDNQIMFLKD